MTLFNRFMLIAALLFSLITFTNAKSNNSRINWIKHEFAKIEMYTKNGTYNSQSKSNEYDGVGSEAKIFYDKNGIVRKYFLSSGTDDSYSSAEYYYDKRGRIFFSYLYLGSVGGENREIRSYYSPNGRLIKRTLKSNTSREIHYYYKITNPKRHFRKF